MEIKSRQIDLLFIAISIITLIGGFFYFEELSSIKNSNEIHPFKDYLTNSGIINISTTQFILAILMISILGIKYLKKGKIGNRMLINGLIIISIGLGLLPWIELWYGSTFYYGEVRDKQGLGFPIIGLAFLIYPFWIFKEEINNLNAKQLTIRLIGTLTMIISSSIFYVQIYEPWKLWQS